MKNSVSFLLKVFLVTVMTTAISATFPEPVVAGTAHVVKKKSKKRKTKRRKKKTRKRTSVTVKNLLNNPDSAVWIRKGKSGIIISKDSAGVVRAMTPYSVNAEGARRYADAVSEYARVLKDDGVTVYSLLVPSQGEYYMPPLTSTAGAEKKTIEIVAANLKSPAVAVLINDTLANHLDENIYSRTDHHWAPLGAFYGSKAFAAAAGVPFRPLSDYRQHTLNNYIGTMYKFSGDAEINKYPEEFVFFTPPEGYETEFRTYKISGGKNLGESQPFKGPFFKNYPDGSSSAYLTFMGGDYCAVKVTNTGGPAGRRLLIVKDSYGNAMASCLFGSFEEVHVVDFRYFPHNLPAYARANGITDMLFVNVLSIGMAPSTPERYRIMMTQKENEGISGNEPTETAVEEEVIETSTTEEEEAEEEAAEEDDTEQE